jgi:hypothetical protein
VHSLILDGRLFAIELLPVPERGVWIAVVGEGAIPDRWRRAERAEGGDEYAAEAEALAGASSFVGRLVALGAALAA